jgi:hypothetical protein
MPYSSGSCGSGSAPVPQHWFERHYPPAPEKRL